MSATPSIDDPAAAVPGLERQLSDLLGLLVLPALCHGKTRAGVLATVVDALSAIVPAEVFCARLCATDPGVEAVSPRPPPPLPLTAVRTAMQNGPPGREAVLVELESTQLRVMVLPIGFYGEGGVLGIASRRPGFPAVRESTILGAVATLASGAIENARLLESVQEADRRKDQFLALLGHELRNPLAPIVTGAQLMRRRNGGPDPTLDVIERQARHMTHLVDDLLDVSRITRGQLTLERKPVLLRDAIADAVELASSTIDGAGHLLSLDLSPEAVVEGDRVRLTQVFTNLLTNAARYTPKGGRIAVTSRIEGGEVVTAVRDSGRGIESGVIERIFEPFVQADRAKDALTGGLGLGLTIVKSIATLHGGAVTARSAGAGQGSEFIVSLPLSARRTVWHEPVAVPERPKGAVSHRRILIVDDNQDAAELLRDALAARGDAVQVAFEAVGALRCCETQAPDTALLDLGLPGMDGYALARLLRARFGPALKLVAITGYGDAAAREAARGAGFDEHLVKPVDLDDVLHALEK